MNFSKKNVHDQQRRQQKTPRTFPLLFFNGIVAVIQLEEKKCFYNVLCFAKHIINVIHTHITVTCLLLPMMNIRIYILFIFFLAFFCTLFVILSLSGSWYDYRRVCETIDTFATIVLICVRMKFSKDFNIGTCVYVLF